MIEHKVDRKLNILHGVDRVIFELSCEVAKIIVMEKLMFIVVLH